MRASGDLNYGGAGVPRVNAVTRSERMAIKFSHRELNTLLEALPSAILSEEEYVRCYTNKRTGKSIDLAITRKSERLLVRIKKLQAKIRREFNAGN